MAQPLDTSADTSAIHRLLGRARLRIRSQWALEGATTAAILAAAVALVAIFLVRLEVISTAAAIGALFVALGIVVGGAVLAACRKLDDELVARRIDRASNLADRLSTAIAFSRLPSEPAAEADDTSRDLMDAAIRDGVRAAGKADVAAATPFVAPTDLRAALGFIAVSALAAGLMLPRPDRSPHMYRATPDHAPPGADVVLEGVHLDPRVKPQLALGQRAIEVTAWDDGAVHAIIPANAALGDTTLVATVGERALEPIKFTVVDPRDSTFHKKDAVEFDPDERAYIESIIAELHNVAQRDKVPELEDFAKKIEQLLKQAENGEITKEKMLEALAQAEDALNKQSEPNEAEVAKKLGDMGQELKKDALTKELGEALEKKDLEKAKEELEKLAEKLDQKELTEQAEGRARQEARRGREADGEAGQAAGRQARPAGCRSCATRSAGSRQQKDKAKNERERQDAERRLEQKREELKKLEKDQQDKDQSDERRALKRLSQDMEKAAENLQKPDKGQQQKDPNDKDGQEQRDKQASQKLKDAARETGRVDQDQRQQATQKKMSSQMDDLREALRRAKQKGNKGPQDPFNKPGQEPGLRAARARRQGQRPVVEARPGSTRPGPRARPRSERPRPGLGPRWRRLGGDRGAPSHDPNLTGDPTAEVRQRQRIRTSRASKAIKAARPARRSSRRRRRASPRSATRRCTREYDADVEEVMRTEKLPASYKYYVKRYFAKIHPSMASAPAPDTQPETTEAMSTAAAANVESTVSAFTADLRKLREEIGTMIVGQEEIVEGVLMCLLGGGHALLEGVPGLGKTMLVRTLAETIHATFSRIQFTPDLMPADIVGTNVIVEDARRQALRVPAGPDLREHRARRRDQPRDAEDPVGAARGDERRLGHGREADLQAREAVLRARDAEPARDGGHLPAARGAARSVLLQARRRVSRQATSLHTILDRTTTDDVPQPQGGDRQVARSWRCASSSARCRSPARSRTTRCASCSRPTRRTRKRRRCRKQYLRYGASPRGLQAIILAAKIRALLEGRYAVAIDDIRHVAPPALRHRLILNFEGEAEGVEGRHDHRRDPEGDEGERSGRAPRKRCDRGRRRPLRTAPRIARRCSTSGS